MKILRALTLSILIALIYSPSLLAQRHIEPRYSYPESVEHYGMTGNMGNRFYTGESLVKNFILKDNEAAIEGEITNYDEPEVNYIMAGRRTLRTGETRRTLQVYEMKPGEGRVFWRAGELPVGAYMMRIIGAVRTEDADLPPKQLVFQMRINDGRRGAVNTYVLRGRGVDSFYCLQEFAFHVVDDRDIQIELTLLPESQTSAFVYNLEIHDILAGCSDVAGKAEPGLYTLEERQRERELFAQTEEGRELLAEIRQQRPLNANQRAQRDWNIWHALPPINSMVQDNYIPVIGRSPSIPVDTGFTRNQGEKCWLLHRIYGGTHGSGWNRPIELVYDQWNRVARHDVDREEVYTLEDYLNHEPLGDTGDRGWGVIRNGRLYAPIIRINTTALQAAWRRLDPDNMDRYYLGNDLNFARDMSLLLVRYAWSLPTYGLHHSIEYATYEASNPWMARRYYQSKFMNHQYALTYDKLYPFIKDNRELAQAVGRFVPWVRTPDDVIKLLDTHLVQYVAKNMLHYRYYYDNTSADMMLQLAAVQANPEITEPWMEFLWSRVYYYPFNRQPLPDILSLNAQRDGTSPIGSTAYATTPSTNIAKLIEPYMRTGGYEKFDLRDFQKYPETIAGCYYPFEACVAGQWSLNIGDVGGPSIRYGRFTDPAENADAGWKWTKDPVFARLLVDRRGRRTETDREWAEINTAARGVPDPVMNARSRAMSAWSGILESGVGHPDFRFHSAAAVRVGFGRGHAHNDALDLRVWAHGAIMSGDFGQRGSYGKPTHSATMCHNVVQIDEDNVGGHSWVRNLADMAGVQYLQAEAVPNQSGLLRRQVALVDVASGMPSRAENPADDSDVVTPNVYVFDVFRAAGGSMHTYAFHGNVDDMNFDINVRNRRVLPRDLTGERAELEKNDPEARYLSNFRWTRTDYMGDEFQPDNADWVADAPNEVLQATWRLSRSAEERMISPGGALTGPRKFTRLHLFGVEDHRVLHGIVIDKQNAAKINPDYPHYAGRCVYVQKRGEEGMKSTYVALVEPYAGEPFISGRRALEVTPSGDGEHEAVAVEVQTTEGHTDVLFADDSPDVERRVPDADMTAQAEFAFVRRDEAGLANISASRVTSLAVGNVTLTTDRPQYTALVTDVDYLTRELTLDAELPADQLRGAFIEIGDEMRRTSYEVDEAREEDGRTVLRMRKSLEVCRTGVEDVQPAAGGATVNTRISKMLEAIPGLWVTNGDYSKVWRLNGAGNSLELDGPATMDDFQTQDGRILLMEAGAGARVTLPTRVSLRRTGDRTAVWQVVCNAPFSIRGENIEISADNGRTWRPLQSDENIPATVGGEEILLRGLPQQ